MGCQRRHATFVHSVPGAFFVLRRMMRPPSSPRTRNSREQARKPLLRPRPSPHAAIALWHPTTTRARRDCGLRDSTPPLPPSPLPPPRYSNPPFFGTPSRYSGRPPPVSPPPSPSGHARRAIWTCATADTHWSRLVSCPRHTPRQRRYPRAALITRWPSGHSIRLTSRLGPLLAPQGGCSGHRVRWTWSTLSSDSPRERSCAAPCASDACEALHPICSQLGLAGGRPIGSQQGVFPSVHSRGPSHL